nr:NTF2 fold immunity protein [Pedobacter sp. ASV2]
MWFVILITVPLLVKCRPGISQAEWDISEGYVPDSTTAVQIAQVLFVRVYGEKVLKKKPFIATLKNGDIWVVEGSVDEGVDGGVDGGVPHIEIQKSDGKIVKLYHYK